jgi:pimeloyl-ACP methyl ester carboxylesterase
VLVHGRTVTGPVAFDLRYPAPGGGTLSLQEGLARKGIDTFAPSLLGYGGSTTFEHGLDDLGNASLRPFLPGGSCPYPEGCDQTHNPIFPLDQQGSLLLVNDLGGKRHTHSSNIRFATTDVWVRDIAQVMDDAIARAQPSDGKVTLVGYSLGALRVGRALDAARFPDIVGKVDRVAFLSPFFGGPTEETPPPQGFVTFPLTLAERMPIVDGGRMATPARESACAGYQVDGSGEQAWQQLMKLQGDSTGLLRLPTFSSYGFNEAVAGQLSLPTLVMQGLDDIVVPSSGSAVYSALPPLMPNKVLVQLDCATHEMLWERAHSTVTAALSEWITNGTFDGAQTGRFTVDASGIASESQP